MVEPLARERRRARASSRGRSTASCPSTTTRCPSSSTSSSSGPGSPACTRCTACARWACASECSSRATASAAPGTGTAIPARAATSSRWTTRTRSREELEQEWEWTRAVSDPAGDPALSQPRRRPLRPPAATSSWARASPPPTMTRNVGGWLHRHRPTACSIESTYCVMASGCLSTVNRPEFDGLDDFEGDWYHTARWPAGGVELAGKRVGVIGTGSTGIQLIPQLAKQAEHAARVPADGQLQHARAQRTARPGAQRAVKAALRRAPAAGA